MNRFLVFSVVIAIGYHGLYELRAEQTTHGDTPANRPHPRQSSLCERLAMTVPAKANREVSYTDAKSAYFYTTTHTQRNTMWFAGWNIATKRVLQDYMLFADGRPLNRPHARVVVAPHCLTRQYGTASPIVETFSMIDNQEILVIKLHGKKLQRIGITVFAEIDSARTERTEEGLYVVPKEAPSAHILIAPYRSAEWQYDQHMLSASAMAEGFVVIYGTTRQDIQQKLFAFRAMADTLVRARQHRIESFLQRTQVTTNLPECDRALSWIGATLHQLITKQQGVGIYAGLPWFNQYWGRDMFIALPGACLVNGQFSIAREILLSFMQFQNMDTTSRYYGRIPNRAQPTDVIYNTTDGTPRFVRQIYEYVQYTHDTALIPLVYPAIKRSIVGSLKHWVDSLGFLTHESADTWMDAKKDGKIPYSPRDNRANDIQALWYEQLLAGAECAAYMHDDSSAHLWRRYAMNVRTQFARYFLRSDTERMVDRLSTDGTPDMQFRPNQLYALDMITNPLVQTRLTKHVWQGLVYPWGVASLAQTEENFHPYHEHWHYYHKDAAYHNGTVWLWNNGMAMQRMIQAGNADLAFRLFSNMNRQALHEGAVGSLAENADALPLPHTHWTRRTGTFLQAWSNAEHLRIWYQYFLGVRPEGGIAEAQSFLVFQPCLPSALTHVQTSLHIGKDILPYKYQRTGTTRLWTLGGKSFSGRVRMMLGGYEPHMVEIKHGESIVITQTRTGASYRRIGIDPDRNEQGILLRSVEGEKLRRAQAAILRGVDFVRPQLRKGLRSVQTYHPTPLTY